MLIALMAGSNLIFAGTKEAGIKSVFVPATKWEGAGQMKKQVRLEILNKSGKNMYVAVHYVGMDLGGGKKFESVKTSLIPPYEALTHEMGEGKADNQFHMPFTMSGATHLAIYDSKPSQEVTFKDRRFSPTPNEAYEFPQADDLKWQQMKTMFLTYDGPGKLRPQSGRLGKTDSNLSLHNNVTAADIKYMPV